MRLGPGHFLAVNVRIGAVVVNILARICGGGCLTDGDVGDDRVMVRQVAGSQESTWLIDEIESNGILD